MKYKMKKATIDMEIDKILIRGTYERKIGESTGNFSVKVLADLGKDIEEELIKDFFENLKMLSKAFYSYPYKRS